MSALFIHLTMGNGGALAHPLYVYVHESQDLFKSRLGWCGNGRFSTVLATGYGPDL